MEPAIRVDGVSKRYRVPAAGAGAYRTLRETVGAAVAAPVRRLRSGRRIDPADEFWSLKDVSFEVSPGEVVGIIGRNGAGKSTLLKILSRITRPTTGRVEINGRVGSLLEVGTGFHPELTGRENVYLNGSILGMSRREIAAKFDEIVAFSGVEAFLDTPVKRYSSGMYVRLAFAVAAHLDPEILIVDEVLAVGDAAFQQKCLNKMRAVAAGGRTVFLVSHNLNSLARLCDTGIMLDRGRVMYRGGAADTIDRYAADADDAPANLPDIAARGHGPRVGLIRGLTVANTQAGRGGAVAFRPTDEMTVEVVVAADPPLDDFRLGIGVNNPYGERTFACASYLAGVDLGGVSGPRSIRIRVRLPGLLPGTHKLDVAVMDDANAVLHGVFPAAQFEVVAADNRFHALGQMRDYGHVTVASEWSVGDA